MDQRYRVLLDALRENGQLDRTIVVFTSDHTFRWRTTGRIPLMIRFPHGEPSGRIASNAQLADIAPTLLDYLDIEKPPWMEGESLLAIDRDDPGRAIFAICQLSSERRTVSRWVREIPNAGPPNYGAKSATLVAAGRWFELELDNGSMRSGTVAGHTLGDVSGMDEERARAAMTDHLTRAGFVVKQGPSRTADFREAAGADAH
jgi:hypothetical protein